MRHTEPQSNKKQRRYLQRQRRLERVASPVILIKARHTDAADAHVPGHLASRNPALLARRNRPSTRYRGTRHAGRLVRRVCRHAGHRLGHSRLFALLGFATATTTRKRNKEDSGRGCGTYWEGPDQPQKHGKNFPYRWSAGVGFICQASLAPVAQSDRATAS